MITSILQPLETPPSTKRHRNTANATVLWCTCIAGTSVKRESQALVGWSDSPQVDNNPAKHKPATAPSGSSKPDKAGPSAAPPAEPAPEEPSTSGAKRGRPPGAGPKPAKANADLPPPGKEGSRDQGNDAAAAGATPAETGEPPLTTRQDAAPKEQPTAAGGSGGADGSDTKGQDAEGHKPGDSNKSEPAFQDTKGRIMMRELKLLGLSQGSGEHLLIAHCTVLLCTAGPKPGHT